MTMANIIDTHGVVHSSRYHDVTKMTAKQAKSRRRSKLPLCMEIRMADSSFTDRSISYLECLYEEGELASRVKHG